MRYVFGLVGLLLAMALALYLSSRQTETTNRTLRRAVPSLQEDVPPKPFDESHARDLVAELYNLLEAHFLPQERLVAIASQCASWAAGSPPGGYGYRVAVKLRAAADELLAAALYGEGRHRSNARRLVLEAQQALDGDPGSLPGPVGGLRDQLENLQQSQRERLQEAERALK